MYAFVCLYHVRVCGVGQAKGSAVVLRLQLALFEVQQTQPLADLPAFLARLGELWQLGPQHSEKTAGQACVIISQLYVKWLQSVTSHTPATEEIWLNLHWPKLSCHSSPVNKRL